jgi:hypothetical protein
MPPIPRPFAQPLVGTHDNFKCCTVTETFDIVRVVKSVRIEIRESQDALQSINSQLQVNLTHHYLHQTM